MKLLFSYWSSSNSRFAKREQSAVTKGTLVLCGCCLSISLFCLTTGIEIPMGQCTSIVFAQIDMAEVDRDKVGLLIRSAWVWVLCLRGVGVLTKALWLHCVELNAHHDGWFENLRLSNHQTGCKGGACLEGYEVTTVTTMHPGRVASIAVGYMKSKLRPTFVSDRNFRAPSAQIWG